MPKKTTESNRCSSLGRPTVHNLNDKHGLNSPKGKKSFLYLFMYQKVKKFLFIKEKKNLIYKFVFFS